MKKEETLLKISSILQESETIDAKKISDEVLSWLIKNVENFIDNQSKLFKMDLIIDELSAETMPETKKLQDLYLSIPDDTKIGVWNDVLKMEVDDSNEVLEVAGECRNTLDKTVAKAYNLMREDSDKLNKLFEKMSFFYELKGINKGRLLIQQLHGSTDIIRFEYEAFDVPVKITKSIQSEQEDGTMVKTDEEVIRKYVVPEGFTVWIEISFKPLEQVTSLF